MFHFRATDPAATSNTYPVTHLNSYTADFQSDKDADTASNHDRYADTIDSARDVTNGNRDPCADTNSLTDLHATAHTHSKPYLDAVPNVDTDIANKHSNCYCYEFAYTDFHGIADATSTNSYPNRYTYCHSIKYANRDTSSDQHSDTHRYPGTYTYLYPSAYLDARSYVDTGADMDVCSCNRYPNSDTNVYSDANTNGNFHFDTH